ncbi:MAG: hypothetical protein J6Q76_04165, partial [Clostridia bacterium]|nr:hypothetical protein [Clostridia bacterium]
TKKDIFDIFAYEFELSHIIKIIREADTFTSSIFTITYYLIDKFQKRRVKSEELIVKKVKSTSFFRNLSIFGRGRRNRSCFATPLAVPDICTRLGRR